MDKASGVSRGECSDDLGRAAADAFGAVDAHDAAAGDGTALLERARAGCGARARGRVLNAGEPDGHGDVREGYIEAAKNTIPLGALQLVLVCLVRQPVTGASPVETLTLTHTFSLCCPPAPLRCNAIPCITAESCMSDCTP